MKAQQDTINNFFSITNTSFAIPVYQRNYAWKEENCAKLLEDIVNIVKDKTKTHFMGTITYIIHLEPQENSIRQIQEYVIIDGQQRITTLMLLLKALQQKSRYLQTKNEIARFVSDDNTTNRLRLKPIRRDREAFTCVMDGRWNEYSGDSRIKKNYHFFVKELDRYMEEGYDIEEIYGAFLRLKIVGIGLEKGDDDPQVVFESINATGVLLDGVDLIRNFLMMGETSQHQDFLYGEYWTPLEEYLLNEKTISDFIECYLRIYYDVEVKKDDIYNLFKKHTKEKFANNIEGLMSELKNYSRLYQIFTNDAFDLCQPNTTSKQLATLKSLIKRIRELKFGVSYPFILQLARDFESGSLAYEDFKNMLMILISYYVRRAINADASNSLNKVLYTLYKHLGTDISSEGLIRNLAQKGGREIFPDDRQIKRSFEITNAYSNKVCKFVLYEIEKLITAEPPQEDKLSIEHFYPQTPTQIWRDLVGNEYKELESSYINTFGNLSLTGQNSALGNRSFDEKIELLLEKGSLKLNEYFTNMTTWGIEEIKERSAYLANQFCRIELFKDLPSEYRTKHVARSLADDLKSYSFRTTLVFPNGQKRHIQEDKGEILIKAVMEYLCENEKDSVRKLLNERANELPFVRDTKENVERHICVKCGNNEVGEFYILVRTEKTKIGEYLAKFIESCNLSPRDFILEN